MPRQLKPRTHAGKTWTKARYWSFIRSALRRAWSKYPVRYQVLTKAKVPYKGKDKRRKFNYRCAHCQKLFKQGDVQVDHILPCGSLNDYEDLPRFVSRLLCEEDNLQVLCSKCHDKKTKEDKENGL